MFTTNLEDGREAPSKARKKGAKRLEFLVSSNNTTKIIRLNVGKCLTCHKQPRIVENEIELLFVQTYCL